MSLLRFVLYHSDSDSSVQSAIEVFSSPGLPGFGDKGRGHASYELAFLENDLWSWVDGLAKS